MVIKCEICGRKIERTFLNKIVGTVIKDEKGKFHYICATCQSYFKNDKQKILDYILNKKSSL